MTSRRKFRLASTGWGALFGLTAVAGRLAAADTNAPAKLTPEQMYEGGTASSNNWIDFNLGEAIVNGNKARYQQQHQSPAGPFGGISDFHYQTSVATNTTLTLDGHAVGELDDYKLKLGLQRDNVGYLRLSYDQSRSFSDGDGGFFPASGQSYHAPDSALSLDRGKLTLEAGWTPEKGPKITFNYTHTSRDGDKGSTERGYAHPTGSVLALGLSPTLEHVNEHGDSFQLDVTDHVKQTDLGLGLHYETGRLEDALKISEYPGEPIQQKITDRQETTYDLFNVHTFTETWTKTNLMISTGFAYSGTATDFNASRIYGNDFDVGYSPNAAAGFGYYGLTGVSRLHEYVFDLNLYYKPAPHFTIVPSLRVDREDSSTGDTGLETLGANAAVPFSADGSRRLVDLRERLDLNYSGITNWAIYGRADYTEGDGNLNENGGLLPVAGIGIPGVAEESDDRRFFQKYSAGVRWYPSRAATLDVGGYYKINHYHYDFPVDSTANNLAASSDAYPDFLAMQDFETYDGNLRLTLRPRQDITAVSRYEFQLSTIHTAPDAASGLPDAESSHMTTHIFAEDVSWIPWSRLSLQAGVNYVLSDTHTPASDITQAVLDSQNNYWTLNFSSGYVVDDKTDLNLSYLYYLSGDYQNVTLGVPYGAGSEEHAVTATATRRLSNRVRLALKYGFFLYRDALYGGNQDFHANVISATLRYQF